MGKRKAVFMSCLLAIAFGITAILVALAEKGEKSEGILCVTSFYPVQLLAESVSEGAEGVTVRNLTENHSGCIHDYTLTTRDMRLLSEAELFFINGGEMELFLEKAAKEYKKLEIVDTSEGYAFLEGVGHNHDHGAGEPEGEELHDHGLHDETDVASCTDPTHHHEVNAHIWMDIDGYLLQLSKVEEAFIKADPAQEALYRKNARACRAELTKLKEAFREAKEELSGIETVVFHEGFVYLLNMLGMETVHCISMDSDTQIAAGEAAEVIEECKFHGITKVFAEADFEETVEDIFGKELSCEVVVLDPITGAGSTQAGTEESSAGVKGVALYCERMRTNLEGIRQTYGMR